MTTAPSMLRRHGTILPTGRGIVLSALHPAHRYARSMFPSRVFDPGELGRVLKDGHQSRKIGKIVEKGPRRGWPIFTLTLEERATCPRSCAAWACCYGNNMQAAERVTAGPELEAQLEQELAALAAAHPAGFLVRLHILGDFYSLAYVELWRRALGAHPALHVFGFTAHLPGADEIGSALWSLATERWARFSIRFSGMPGPVRASRLVAAGVNDDDALPCPAQTGASDCCATCTLCFNPRFVRSIGFRPH